MWRAYPIQGASCPRELAPMLPSPAPLCPQTWLYRDMRLPQLGSVVLWLRVFTQLWNLQDIFKTRPTLERRKTLGHLRSINRNMIIHFANQSQTCQLLKIKKKFFFSNFSWKETVKNGAINPILNWYRKSISIIKSVIYIYNIYMSGFWHDILTISPRCVNRNLTGGR